MRLILYTGKGGVGKSSLAAATAVRTAELGRRTLLVSSDLAHNLSDIFDRQVGGDAVELTANLSALEVDPLKEIRDQWRPAHDYFIGLLAYLGMENAVAEEVALIPGMDEFFLLTRILRELESDRYDVVIVDCSPTGGTIRLLTLSDSACSKLNKLLEAERIIMKLARPFSNQFKAGRAIIPEDEVYGVFEQIIRQIGRLGAMLKNPQISSVRLVLNPDRVAIAETRRAFTYFGLFGFPLDGIFVNKVLPAELADGYLHDWFQLQRRLLALIDESFLEVSQFRIPLLDREPIGFAPLAEMARTLFGETYPDQVLSPARSVSMSRQAGRQQLTFWLPQVQKQEVEVRQKDSDLVLTAGAYTRVFSLPDSLIGRPITGAEFSQGQLTITFADAPDQT